MLVWNWLGRQPIEKVLALQEHLFLEKLAGDKKNYILFAEHESVYTDHFCLTDSQRMWRRDRPPDIPFVGVCRGGRMMYHGPGQIVCYCICDLRSLGVAQITNFAKVLDESVIRVLTMWNIKGYCKEKPMAAQGVWVRGEDGGEHKIASRGFKYRLRSSLTRFGFALNVSTDLSFFDVIYPCGLDISITSVLQEKGRNPKLESVALALAEEIAFSVALPLVRARDLLPDYQKIPSQRRGR